jgi:hypothetical protein
MGLPRGNTIRLSPARRFVSDLMWASQRVPLVSVERTMPLADVIAARQRAPRLSWFAIFMKGYAVVSARRPDLRRAYLTWPYERIHQHACTVASVAIARRVGEEDGVLNFQTRSPEQMTLAEIDARLRAARTDPLDQCGDFRRALRLVKLPRALRRLAWWAGLEVSGHWRAKYAGTFGLTSTAALGSAVNTLLSPLTTTITYGVFAPDGRVTVRIFFDHRVLDGLGAAAALEELEGALNGPIREELLRGAAAESRAA